MVYLFRSALLEKAVFVAALYYIDLSLSHYLSRLSLYISIVPSL